MIYIMAFNICGTRDHSLTFYVYYDLYYEVVW